MTSHPSVDCSPQTLRWLVGGLAFNPSKVPPTPQQRLGFAQYHPPLRGFPGGSVMRNLPATAGATGDWVWSLSPGLGRCHPARVLAWRIPRTGSLPGCSCRVATTERVPTLPLYSVAHKKAH